MMALDVFLLLHKNGPDLLPYLRDLEDRYDNRFKRPAWKKVLGSVSIAFQFVSGYAAIIILLAWARRETFIEGLVARLEEELK
jgi:hypothetical protein